MSAPVPDSYQLPWQTPKLGKAPAPGNGNFATIYYTGFARRFTVLVARLSYVRWMLLSETENVSLLCYSWSPSLSVSRLCQDRYSTP